jgi:hypothetical protein
MGEVSWDGMHGRFIHVIEERNRCKYDIPGEGAVNPE